MQKLGASKSPSGTQQKERRKHLRGCWLSFSSASFCRLFPAFVARKVLDGIFCPSICVCVCVCVSLPASMCLCSWGGGGLSTPTPLLNPPPPAAEMLKLPKNKAPLNFFMLTYFVVSSYLQLWFLFIFACEPPPQSEKKKENGGGKSSGNRNPRERENGGTSKQLQVEGKFLDMENFLGMCFSRFSLPFPFASVHFKMRHFLVCWPGPMKSLLPSSSVLPSGSFMNFLQSGQVFSPSSNVLWVFHFPFLLDFFFVFPPFACRKMSILL